MFQEQFSAAYALAIRSHPDPVYLSLPMDDMDKPCPLARAPRRIHARISAEAPNTFYLCPQPRDHEYAVLQSYASFFELESVPGLKIPGIDIEALAKGYGVRGETVSDARLLGDAIKRGLDHDGPFVLQVDVVEQEPPLMGESGPKTQRETFTH
jgi:thiamine pyrophosphate-dependent acetolactate synthase large subunit-like protein